jgi:hypothetical protein
MTDYFDLSNAQVITDPDEERYIHDVNTRAIIEGQEDSLQRVQSQQPQRPPTAPTSETPKSEPEQPGGPRDIAPLKAAADFADSITDVAVQAPLLGVGDFVSDVAGLLPLTKGIDEWWDKTATRSESQVENAVRDASSIIIPTLIGTKLAIKGGNLAAQSANLSKRQQLLGKLAAGVGVDTAVTAIASTSERDDNVAGALNKWLGWDIPWATRDGDSPDVIRAKNVLEAAGLAGATSVLEGFFALRKGATQLKPKDALAAEAIEARQAAKAVDEDEVVAAVANRELLREDAITQEAIRKLEADPQGMYDPFVNNIYEAQKRGVNNVDVDPFQAKIDHALIQQDLGTTNGRASSVVTDNVMEGLMNAQRGSERANYLDDLWLRAAPSADARINIMREGRVEAVEISAKDINKSIDNLFNATTNSDITIEQFKGIVKEMRRDVFNSHKVLDEAGWVTTSRAFKQAFDTIYNPNNLRASALITQNAADNVADTIKAERLISDVADTSRQQELIIKKLEVMAGEMKVRSWTMGSGLEFLKFKQGKKSPDEIAAWMNTRNQAFDEVMAAKSEKGREFVQTYTKIAKENPEFLKPLWEIYDYTNGKVDDLQKLHRYMEHRVGVVGKAFYDGATEIPSTVIQGAQAARYNHVLLGRAPIRTVGGNAIGLITKPVSILAGSKIIGGGGDEVFRRALYGFGGIAENLQRAWKHMGDEWRAVNANPEAVASRGRADEISSIYDDFTAIESYVQNKWANSANPGDLGRVAAWNLAKIFHAYNGNKLVRLGVNALHSLDGFVNSMMASMGSRFKAYDEVFSQTKGAFDQELFNAKQRELYSQAFDESGLIKDEAIRFASKELTLQLDYKVVDGLENIMKHVPVAKGLFLFPKTGLNGVEFAWSFNPLSSMGLAVGRVRRAFSASTPDQIAAVLREHGIDPKANDAEIAFKTLKSEYLGRQLMGSTVVMAAGMYALAGNLTGNGPQDGAERRRMIEMGFKPNSIRNPVTGEWLSYKGMEPFSDLLSLVGDIVYQSNRVDQPISEDWFRKLSFAISMNVANKTFLSGFEPLVSMLSGDEAGWNRFVAMQADSVLPGTGIRSILSAAITPQLKDVENDIGAYLQNRNKFLYNGNERLKDLLDVYTGERIRHEEPLTAAINSLLPFLNTNGGTEPWREWLLKTGWDGLQTVRTNPVTKQPLTAEERQYINNWIGKNSGLAAQIDQLRQQDEKWWDKKIKEFQKKRGNLDNSVLPVKELATYDMLDRIHNEAFKQAWSAYESENSSISNIPAYRAAIKGQLNQGNVTGAVQSAQELQQILQIRK